MTYNIYMVDDDEAKLRYIPILVDMLEKDKECEKLNIKFRDGYNGEAPKLHKDAVTLNAALHDDKSIFLLDFRLIEDPDECD